MSVIGTVLIDVKADTAKLVSGMDRAEKTIKQKVDNIKRTLLTMAAAYASIESVRTLKNMVNDSIEAADATGKLAQKLGMSSKKLSELQYAAGYAAVSTTQLNAAFSAMIRRTTNFVRTGGGAAKTALNELGISAEFARKNFTSTSKTFEILVNRLSKLPDGYRKTAIAQDLFSKNASDVIRLADMGSKEIKRLSDEADRFGIAVPDSVSKMAAAYDDIFDHMKQKTNGYKKLLSYEILPYILAFAKTVDKWMSNAFNTGGIDEFGKHAHEAIKDIIYSFGFLKDVGTGIEIVIKSLEIGFYGLASVVSLAFEPIRAMINGLIEANNTLANSWIGKKAGMGTIDFKLESSLPDIITKIKSLSGEVVGLSTHLHDGRDAAKKFGNDFEKTLKNTIKLAKDYTAITSKSTKINNDGKAEALKNLKKIQTELKVTLSQYLNYYTKIGDYQDAWNIKEKQLRENNSHLTKEELNKLVATYKKEYFDAIYKKAEDEKKKELELQKKKAQEELRLHGSTTQGMSDQFKRYVDSMPTEYEQGIEMMKTITQSLNDAWTDFFDDQSKGFLDFGNLAKSVLRDVEKQMIKTQIVQPLTSATSSIVSSVGSSIVDSLFSGWADGGYTYRTHDDKTPVGVVHANEYVIPANMVRSHPSLVAGLEAERRGLKPFDVGGFGGGLDGYGGDATDSGGYGMSHNDGVDGFGGGNHDGGWGNNITVTNVYTNPSRLSSPIAPADQTVVNFNANVKDMFSNFDAQGNSLDNKGYTFSINPSKYVGAVLGGLTAGSLGSLVGSKLGSKFGKDYSFSVGAGDTLDETMDKLAHSMSSLTSDTNAQTEATQSAASSLSGMYGNGDHEGAVTKLSDLTKTQVEEITKTLTDGYKTDVISATKEIWQGLVGAIPDVKADAQGDWATLFSNYLEQGNEALLKSALDGSIFDTPNFYKTWEEYAKGMNESVNTALSSSFNDMGKFKFDYTNFLLKDNPTKLNKYNYDYYQNIAQQAATTVGADYSTLNKSNFLEKMNSSIKSNLTPDNISNWEKLGNALMDAYKAEEKYRSVFENNVPVNQDMLLPNLADATNTDMQQLKNEVRANNEETSILFYEILKELKTQTSLQQGLPA